jgi:hypothetical protein
VIDCAQSLEANFHGFMFVSYIDTVHNRDKGVHIHLVHVNGRLYVPLEKRLEFEKRNRERLQQQQKGQEEQQRKQHSEKVEES